MLDTVIELFVGFLVLALVLILFGLLFFILYWFGKEFIRYSRIYKKKSRVEKALNNIQKAIDFNKENEEIKSKYNLIKDEVDSDNYEEANKHLDEFLSQKEFNSIEELMHSYGYKKFEGEWLEAEKVHELKSAKIGLDNNFQTYSPYEFEEFIADLFKQMGYKARVTPAQADYGLDVIAEKEDEKIGIQVKRYSETNKVGAPDVQKTLGSIYKANADRTILVTTSSFTRNAEIQARNAPIELWDKYKLHKKVRKHCIEKEMDKKYGEECFIATAAYQTPMANEIEILRKYRDNYLLKKTWGQKTVKTYYKLSPPIAKTIGKHKILRKTTRKLLKPIIYLIKTYFKHKNKTK